MRCVRLIIAEHHKSITACQREFRPLQPRRIRVPHLLTNPSPSIAESVTLFQIQNNHLRPTANQEFLWCTEIRPIASTATLYP
jgi:hypothetical protein